MSQGSNRTRLREARLRRSKPQTSRCGGRDLRRMPDITSTFFGLTIAFLAPGMVGLYSLKYWLTSTNRVFETVLTAKSNAGLFLMVILGALVLGLVVSAIRW